MPMGFNPTQQFQALGGASIGNLLSPWKNPAGGANDYLGQIPGQMHDLYDPYIQAGQRQLPGLESQYGQLMNSPGARMNQIGADYQQSPGYQFQLDQALQASGNAAAAGGMAGSPMHEQQNMQLASNIANQDYNKWLSQALGLYNTGLSGGSHLYDIGFEGTNQLAQSIMDMLMGQAENAYAGQSNANQHWSGSLGGLGASIGGLMGGSFW